MRQIRLAGVVIDLATDHVDALDPLAAVMLAQVVLPGFQVHGVRPNRAAVDLLRTTAADLPGTLGMCGHCKNCMAFRHAAEALADDLELTLDAYGVDNIYEVATMRPDQAVADQTPATTSTAKIRPFMARASKMVH